MLGSRHWLSFARRDCSAVGVVNVNEKSVGGGCASVCIDGNCSFESIAACAGSSIETSISDKLAAGASFDGAGGGGMDVADFWMSSHAAFSASRLFSC